jgi:hypothetical protein
MFRPSTIRREVGLAIKGSYSMNVLIVSDVRLHREGLACLLEPVPTIRRG